MRNLKKVLSLALALAMLVSMMIVGASAATALDVYPDAEDITYKEAVDLLTAIDVLQGDEGGFRPTDTLTREEAAKIVAYVSLGVDAAEALSVTKAPFTDVAATRWSAGYIAYCANVGIINGMGDGTFRPTDKVTGYQMAKMLLCVLGYGVNDEYVGSNWALNVSKDGVTTGLFDRLSNVGNTPATREEAAQLAYNAVTMNMVAYSTLYGTYSFYTYEFGGQTLLGTKARKIFNVVAVPETDAYGYEYEYWKFVDKAAPITDSYLTDTILGTVTGGTIGAMYKSYSWDTNVEIWENGTNAVASNVRLGEVAAINIGDGVAGLAATTLRNNPHKAVAYNGQTVTVVDRDNDGEADKLIVVNSYLAKVTKVNAATASADRTVTVEAYAPNANYATFAANIETEDYAVGDYILVDPAMTLTQVQAVAAGGVTVADILAGLQAGFGTNALGTKAAEVVTSTITAYYNVSAAKAGSGSVITDSVTYKYNGIYEGAGYALGQDLADGTNPYTLRTATYNLYLDANGNVIGATVVEDSIKDYVYISAIGEDAWKWDNVVNVLFSDGTSGTYTLTANSYGYDRTANNGNDVLALGEICAYSVDGSNITLTKLDTIGRVGKYQNPAFTSDADSEITSFVKGGSTIVYTNNADQASVAYATDTTVFTYVAANGVVTRYVGKNNAPSITAANTGSSVSIATERIGTTTYATYVVISATPAEVAADYLYITSPSWIGYSYNKSGAMIYWYNAVKNGEATVIAATNAALTNGTNVYYYSYNADAYDGFDNGVSKVEAGVYTLSYIGTNVTSGTVRVTANNDVVVLDSVALDDTSRNIAYGAAQVIDLTSVPVNAQSDIVVGDQVTVVYSTVGGLKIAKTVYITTSSTVMDGTALATGLNNGTITSGRYTVNGDWALPAATTIPADVTVYVTGNVTTNALTVNGAAYVTGSVATATVSGTLEANAVTNLTLAGNGNALVIGAVATLTADVATSTLTASTITNAANVNGTVVLNGVQAAKLTLAATGKVTFNAAVADVNNTLDGVAGSQVVFAVAPTALGGVHFVATSGNSTDLAANEVVGTFVYTTNGYDGSATDGWVKA